MTALVVFRALRLLVFVGLGAVAASTAGGGVVSSLRSARAVEANTAQVALPEKSRVLPYERFIAGGLGRMSAQLVLYPVDALRTLAQSRAAAQVGTMTLLSGVGVNRLISGCVTTSFFALAVGALQFSIIGTLSPTLGTLGAAMCGAVSSCVASVPQEVIKQRLVTGIYPSFAHAVRNIYATDGIRGFYCGWAATASRNVPFVVVTFTTFAALKQLMLGGRDEGAQLSAAENTLLGVLSSLAAGIVTQPMDVVKTRLMTQAASNARPYTGAVDCARTMWAQEGPTSFFSGLWQRAWYMGPLWAIQFGVNGQLLGRLVAARREREERYNPTQAAPGRHDSALAHNRKR